MRKQLAAEFLKFRHDYALAGCLAFLLVPLFGAAAGLPDTAQAGSEAVAHLAHAQFAAMAPTLMTVAAVYGSLRFTMEYRLGAVARTALLGPRTRLLWAKATAAVLGGVIVGLVGTAALAVVLRLVLGHTGMAATSLPRTVAVCGISGAWGLFVGSVVRHHLASLFIVPASLLLSLPFLNSWPWLGRFSPLGSQMALTSQTADLLSAQTGALVALAWLVGAAVFARLLLTGRDLA
ncbi:ABC transporter permease [Streptomyces sp. NPDC093707]|uniref:ABC transporter permease n=1 Tax=Streptomyces sp. NPDC093707 TaxID=3154984 RepID=UPI003450AAE5